MGNLGDEERKKGILKHARTYSNKHVDFNLNVEFVPFDEAKDFTIEIQIVEEMPKKVVSYAALFAQQKVKEDEEKLTKEKEKSKKPNKIPKTQKPNSSGNMNPTQENLSSIERSEEEKIGEEPVESSTEDKGETNEDSKDEIFGENEIAAKEDIISEIKKQEIGETNEEKELKIANEGTPEAITENEEGNDAGEKIVDEINKNVVETSSITLDETKKSLDELGEKNLSKNNKNINKGIEENVSLIPKNCLELTTLEDNESNLKESSESSASLQEKNKSDGVKEQFPKEYEGIKSTIEEKERFSDDEYQDALSSNEIINSEIINHSKNIELYNENIEKNNLCESKYEKGKNNIVLEAPNESGENNNFSDNTVEEFQSTEDQVQNPLLINVSNNSASSSLKENIVQDCVKKNEKQEELPATKNNETENPSKEIAKSDTHCACNEQSDKDTYLSNLCTKNESNESTVMNKIKENIVLLPPNEKEAESTLNNISSQTKLENILSDSLSQENTSSVSSDLISNVSTDSQQMISFRTKLGLSNVNENCDAIKPNNNSCGQNTALANEITKSSSEVAQCDTEIDKSSTTIPIGQRETDQINEVSAILNERENVLGDSEQKNKKVVNEPIVKLKNVCEIDNQRVTERLSELP